MNILMTAEGNVMWASNPSCHNPIGTQSKKGRYIDLE